MDDELRSHVKRQAGKYLKAGLPREEAMRRARIDLGGLEQVREECRDAWAVSLIVNAFQDARFGMRQLRRSPGFTVVVVLTLALGIGATTAIFSLVQQVMYQSLPVAKPAELWRIGDAAYCCYSNGYTQGNGSDRPANDWNIFSWEAYKLFRANTRVFRELAAFQIGEGNAELGVRRAGSSEPVSISNGEYVSGNFFRMFEIPAWRGRIFSDADDQEGAPPVAVMSFHAWQEKYESDPSVVGGTFDFNGHPFTVIGITPPGFFGAKVAASAMPDFWLPLTVEPMMAGPTSRLKNPRLAWLDLIGRIQPGTNSRTLESQLQVELHQWLASHIPDMTPEEKLLWQMQTLHVAPGGGGVSLLQKEYKEALWLLLLAAVCVLLVACANIANLLLARGVRDRRQTALRAALGASRGRLARKALVESLTLSGWGAVTGIGVAYAGARLILHLAFARSESWIPMNAAPSIPVLLFTLGISVLTGVTFGTAPAWMAMKTNPIGAISGPRLAASGGRGILAAAAAQKALVIVQASVTVVLLSAAAMLAQSLRNLEHQDFGFSAEGRFLVSIDPKISNYKPEQTSTLYSEIEERFRAIPGVRGVGSVLEAPLAGWVWPHDIQVEGKQLAAVSSGWTRITPGFFETMGDKIVLGRPVTDDDTSGTRPVAVVNQSFAKRLFGDENPVGQHFGPAPDKNSGMYEIVGVAADLDFAGGPQPMYFLPEAQSTSFDEPESKEREVWSHYLYSVVIWAPENPPGLETQVRSVLASVDPNLVVYGVEPYLDVVHGLFTRQNMIASLTWLFGAVGLLLAAVGLYGITAYGVEQRTGEIGVRMALGADRRSVMGMVLRETFWQVGVGLALGIPAAIGVGRLIASQLFGVKFWDPMLITVATILLVMAALIAAAVPARRAASVAPIEALRHE